MLQRHGACREVGYLKGHWCWVCPIGKQHSEQGIGVGFIVDSSLDATTSWCVSGGWVSEGALVLVALSVSSILNRVWVLSLAVVSHDDVHM